MTDLRQVAIDLYDRYTHEGMDRRAFMAEMTRIAGSAAAATTLLAGIAASPAAAAISSPTDARLVTRRENWTLPGGRKMSGYAATLRSGRGKRPSVMVVHENRGLTRHIEDVTRRVALAGYYAVGVDFLSPLGGTPADENAARDLIGKLDLGQSTADGIATLARLKRRRGGNGKVGAIGFCWGGAMVNRLAVGAGTNLDAGVPYYGTAPAPAEAAAVRAPLLIHLASLDARVNTTVGRGPGGGWQDRARRQSPGCESRLQQRHVRRTLRQVSRRPGLGADAGLFRSASALNPGCAYTKKGPGSLPGLSRFHNMAMAYSRLPPMNASRNWNMFTKSR